MAHLTPSSGLYGERTPDVVSPTLVVNVTLTDEGFEPSTIFLPAGRHIRLVVRNRGTSEHHFRVAGLIPANLQWIVQPEYDEYDIATMDPSDLESLGIDPTRDDLEHVLHHLTPSGVAFKPESLSGIKPLPNEVHAYAYAGNTDALTFFPVSIGTFVAEDPLHPEITGKVVVFDDSGSS